MSSFIYVIESESGLRKIGFTANPRRRLYELRTSTAGQLTLLGVVPGTKEDERALHLLLSPWNVAREWFRPCRAMQPLIDALWRTAFDPQHAEPDLNTVGGLVATLGGTTKAGRILGASPQAVWNWVERKKLPVEKYLEHKAVLDGMEISVPDALWFPAKAERLAS